LGIGIGLKWLVRWVWMSSCAQASRFKATSLIFLDHGPEGSNPAVTDSLAQRIGDRIRSRLYEMCKDIKKDGKDFRAEIKQANHHF